MIYVHVPFCRSFCTYCDFYSELCRSASQQVQNAYMDSLLAEVAARATESCPSQTLYIGGGTPSVLPGAMLQRIVEALGDAEYEEFTVEVNPDDIVEKGEEYVRELLGMGVNRISMGVQSFDDGILRWMGRRHDAAGARKAFSILRAAGVKNISIDLIFGLPQLTDDGWLLTLDAAVALGPEHISAYQLSVEDGSALGEMAREGKFTPASEELCARQYEALCQRLAEAGYRHYEISNWALPGREAVHNSAYWRRVPYVGLGPGAHSLSFRDGRQVRSWNSETLSDWTSESEILSEEEAAEEEVLLALRTARGIGAGRLRALTALLQGSDAAVDRMLSSGALVALPDGNLRIPEGKLFVSDDIIAGLV